MFVIHLRKSEEGTEKKGKDGDTVANGRREVDGRKK